MQTLPDLPQNLPCAVTTIAQRQIRSLLAAVTGAAFGSGAPLFFSPALSYHKCLDPAALLRYQSETLHSPATFPEKDQTRP